MIFSLDSTSQNLDRTTTGTNAITLGVGKISAGSQITAQVQNDITGRRCNSSILCNGQSATVCNRMGISCAFNRTVLNFKGTVIYKSRDNTVFISHILNSNATCQSQRISTQSQDNFLIFRDLNGCLCGICN